jgi:hypothetical protein
MDRRRRQQAEESDRHARLRGLGSNYHAGLESNEKAVSEQMAYSGVWTEDEGRNYRTGSGSIEENRVETDGKIPWIPASSTCIGTIPSFSCTFHAIHMSTYCTIMEPIALLLCR